MGAKNDLEQVCRTIDSFIAGAKSMQRMVEATTAVELTCKGRFAKNSVWHREVFAAGAQFRLTKAAVINDAVVVLAAPDLASLLLDASDVKDISHVRIPLAKLNDGTFAGFKESIELFMQGTDLNTLEEIAERAKERQRREEWEQQVAERGQIFGSW